MEELCIQKPRIKEIEKRRATVHDIPSSIIEFTKEDKKIVEYTLIWTYWKNICCKHKSVRGWKKAYIFHCQSMININNFYRETKINNTFT